MDLSPSRWLDPARVRRIAALWLVAAAAAGALHLLGETRAGLTDGRGHPFGEDFLNFWTGARLAAQGVAATVYDAGAFHRAQEAAVGGALQPYDYSYPPAMLWLTAPLAALPYPLAWALWSLTGVAAFGAAMAAAVGSRRGWLFALAAPGAFVTLMEGQTGLLTAGALGGFLMLRERRPLLAGALCGLLVCKPQLGLLAPLALVCARDGRAIAGAALSASALIAGATFAYGPTLWVDYLHHAQALGVRVLRDGEAWSYVASPFVMVRHLGASEGWAWGAQALSAAGASLAVVATWARPASRELRHAVFLTASLMVSPYVQHYDLAVLTLAAVWLVREAAAGRTESGERDAAIAAAALLVLAPALVHALAGLTGVALGWLLPLPALALAVALRMAHRRAETARADRPAASSSWAGAARARR